MNRSGIVKIKSYVRRREILDNLKANFFSCCRKNYNFEHKMQIETRKPNIKNFELAKSSRKL